MSPTTHAGSRMKQTRLERGTAGGRRRLVGERERPRSAGRLRRLLPWLAVAAALTIYARALSYQFVYDDIEQIVTNPRLQSWEFVPQYFAHDVWSRPGQQVASNYYRPLFLLWLRVNNELFALEPAGYHGSAIMLHALATLFFYLLAARTLNDRLTAGFAALIFAVHPLHVESVAWISGANEPEFALFFLAAMLCYLRRRDAPQKDDVHRNAAHKPDAQQDGEVRSRAWLAGSLLCFGLALLSKETAAVLCGMIFVYEWQRQPSTSRSIMHRVGQATSVTLPYVVVTGAYVGARAYALRGIAPDMENQASRATFLFTLPAALWFYLRKLLWPLPLSAFYPFHFVEHPGVKNFGWPLAASLALLTGLWIWSRRRPEAGIASAWLLLPLAPPLLAISHFLRHDLVHDRYLYLPSAGLAMLIAMGLRRLRPGDRGVAGIPRLQLAAGLLLAAALGAISIQQEGQWRNEMALYTHGVETAPQNALALNHLAMLLVKEKNDLPAARALGERALAAAPDEYETLLAAGILRGNVHDEDGALPLFQRARQLEPDRREPYYYLGTIYLDKQQFPEAEAMLRQAVRLAPDEPDQHVRLGYALEKQGRLAEALQEYQAELQIQPGSALAGRRLALVRSSISEEKKPGP